MVKKNPTPPRANHLITSFISGSKRSADDPRIRSPTNETSSPDKKNQKSDDSMEIDIPNENAIQKHELTPKEICPQRDKNNATEEKETENIKATTPNKVMEGNTAVNDSTRMDVDTFKEREKEKHQPTPRTISPQRDKPRKEPPMATAEEETAEDANIRTDPPQKDPVIPKPKKQVKIPSAMRKTYLEKAGKEFPAPLLPQWKCHRVACMFEIDRPENKSARTQILASELNKMLTAARDYVDKGRVYVRKYKDHFIPRDSERKEWLSQFDRKKASDLNLFTFGFYAFQEPRGGMHRLLLQLVVPQQTNIPDLLMNINNHTWASKNGRRVMDIKEQNLHAPKNIGWLFRSNYLMASSTELQEVFEDRGGIHFGLTFKTIPLVQKGNYNKDTAVKAVCISTNEEDKEVAWRLLMQWYNAKKPKFPLGIPMRFVPSKEHPDISNNPTAIKNISILMERQRMFLEDTDSVQCAAMATPDETIGKGNRTLRQELMTLTATTMGKEYLGAKLFHAITLRVTLSGEKSYYFTFHKALEREALSVVSGLGPFIRKELKLNPDIFCFPHAIDPTHKWNIATRCVSNNTTSYLEKIAGKDHEDDTDPMQEKEIYVMTDKRKREARRIMGLNDEETVNRDLKQPKTSFPDIPSEVHDDASARSALSGLTNYSTSTAASKERKALRKEVIDQQTALDEHKEEIARLTRELEALSKRKTVDLTNTRDVDSEQSSSGENTSESPDGKEGWDSDIEFSDEVEIKPARQKEKTIDSDQDSDSDAFQETDFYDENGNEKSCLVDMDPDVDGLKFIARGSPMEIRQLQKGLKNRQSVVSSTFRFKDMDEEWVELYEIIDVDKFTSTYSSEITDKSTAVRFSDQGQIQEFDPDQSTLQLKAKKVTLDGSDSDSNPEDDSNEESGDDESSTNSSLSNLGDVLVQKSITKTSLRSTNITSAVINDAKEVSSTLISDTTGSGSFNV